MWTAAASDGAAPPAWARPGARAAAAHTAVPHAPAFADAAQADAHPDAQPGWAHGGARAPAHPEPQVIEREPAVLGGVPLLAEHTAGKLDCLPACAFLVLCGKSCVPCCSSCFGCLWCSICCRWVSREMLVKCLSFECGPMCRDHCFRCKCFSCSKDAWHELSCCENMWSCILYIPFSIVKCTCAVWKFCGCTSGCACYCPSTLCGIGCIAPFCPGCYCIKMSPEDQQFWASPSPFEVATTRGKVDAGTQEGTPVGAENSRTALAKKQPKPQDKGKKHDQHDARVQQSKDTWGALVNAQGGASGM